MTEKSKKNHYHSKVKRWCTLKLFMSQIHQKVTNTLNFYASYHQNTINQKIHIVCIPLLVWTVMVWFANIPFPLTGNLANVLVIAYVFGYSLYDFKVGLIAAVFLCMFSYTAAIFAQTIEGANFMALILHGMAWALQIYGHSQFEGRRPAFLDNLLQSLYIAPLFTLIEVRDFLRINKGPFA